MTRNRNQNAIGLNLYHAFISHDGSQGWENAWSDVVRFVRTISVEIMTRRPLPQSESKNADENEENYKNNGDCDVLFGHADRIWIRRTQV
ncbi:hypothetical protein VTN49DRAFT_23 [Thermomyces lanuginosus]|uniref:uncharacterized protein n=1 Tax=Thermomyces lanuginosus TaxID=5541 RepID=UPI0037431C94